MDWPAGHWSKDCPQGRSGGPSRGGGFGGGDSGSGDRSGEGFDGRGGGAAPSGECFNCGGCESRFHGQIIKDAHLCFGVVQLVTGRRIVRRGAPALRAEEAGSRKEEEAAAEERAANASNAESVGRELRLSWLGIR